MFIHQLSLYWPPFWIKSQWFYWVSLKNISFSLKEPKIAHKKSVQAYKKMKTLHFIYTQWTHSVFAERHLAHTTVCFLNLMYCSLCSLCTAIYLSVCHAVQYFTSEYITTTYTFAFTWADRMNYMRTTVIKINQSFIFTDESFNQRQREKNERWTEEKKREASLYS